MLPADTLQSIGAAARAAADKKAFHIIGFEVTELTSYTDSLLICSGASDRQVTAIADAVRHRLKEIGRRPLHVEGEGRSEWVLLDYGDFVMHVFTEERRAYYGLDSVWSDAPRVTDEALGVAARAPQ
jgi:ribosome-associated protein